jgi:hypothetical protein
MLRWHAPKETLMACVRNAHAVQGTGKCEQHFPRDLRPAFHLAMTVSFLKLATDDPDE